MTCGPDTTISPTSPCGTGSPSGPRIDTVVPGSGRPTDWGRWSSSSGGMIDTRLHSVWPNWRTTRTPGNADRSAPIVGADSAAPVLVISRTGGGGSTSRCANVVIIVASDGTMGTTVAPTS